ncbi:MAG: DUF3841 domain-containing protein [Armatimonadetes bacterium]|nr:DUF3841 domain-containing protein [Armatimonadota bacterium]
MQLWTIQPLVVWEILQKKGVFYSDLTQSEHVGDYPEAYRWITRRLTQHAGNPPAGCSTPIWAWYQRHGEARRKPDLRWFRHWVVPGDWVRIEIEMSETETLLSDFNLWYYCMTYWYISDTEEENNRFEAELLEHGLNYYRQKPLPDAKYHAQIERSWERIFDWERVDSSSPLPRAEKWVQAVFWELRLDRVRAMTPFRGAFRIAKSKH